jgi:hypothetical protein
MFDDLRNDASKQYEEEVQAEYQPAAVSSTGQPRRRSTKILGMTSIQRFVLVFLLMTATCVIGFLCLFVTGKIAF